MQHLLTDTNSHVQKHLFASPDCKKCTPSSFTIIDSARAAYSLKLKEAIYIARLNEKSALKIGSCNITFIKP